MINEADAQAAQQTPPVLPEVLKLKKELMPEIGGDDKKDQALSQMAGHPGWPILKKFITELQNTLQGLTQSTWADPALTDAEIGARFRAASLTAEMLQRVIDRVEVSSKVIAAAGEQKAERKRQDAH